jgi:fructokinase
MTHVLCFGEALIDFLNVGETNAGGLMLADFRQFPGGAPANVAVAVARLGGKAKFAGQVGDDQFGRFLEEALLHYGVDTTFLHKHPSAHTTLAFVFLDGDGDRSFSFYRDRTADVLFSMEQVRDEWFLEHPVVHFCSNTLTNEDIGSVTEHVLERAAAAGCRISFDVNLRPALWPEACVDRSRCESAARFADFIKCSQEEIEFLSNRNEGRFVDACLSGKTGLLVVTDGANPVRYFTRTHRGTLDTPKVAVIDTTAAGDAFTAGVLRGLSATTDPGRLFDDRDEVESLLRFAIQCGALATTRPGAFPSLPVFNEVAEFWTGFR